MGGLEVHLELLEFYESELAGVLEVGAGVPGFLVKSVVVVAKMGVAGGCDILVGARMLTASEFLEMRGLSELKVRMSVGVS